MPRMCSLLEACLFHQCLDIVLKPLKQAAQFGCIMSDLLEQLHYCFTTLASYICDTPETCLIACVQGQTSLVTMATSKEFGNQNRHLPHTIKTTLCQLHSIKHFKADSDIKAYFEACEPYHLSGVALPFWCNWPFAQPSKFPTPEGLHEWHWECWDHDVYWCRCTLSDGEIDFHFSILSQITSLYHFSKGITKLKQAPAITLWTQDRIQVVLDEFHNHKQVILDHGLHQGQHTVFDHFNILKLKLM
ncbi:hypothetical protein J3R82DRAFT_9054 [Butyriboletus roseoflavus]|nr:hypothetical protein J3R82DRAFT_9054 [Butyriboletus roseoflavus]